VLSCHKEHPRVWLNSVQSWSGVQIQDQRYTNRTRTGIFAPMRLVDFLDPGAVSLDLSGTTPEAVRAELVALLHLGDRAHEERLCRLLARRERLGSTGIGRGIAIPHCRSLGASRLHLAFGRHRTGLDYSAIDGRPVRFFFLIVAPPVEVANQYLPVLGRIASLARDREVPRRLARAQTVEDILAALENRPGDHFPG